MNPVVYHIVSGQAFFTGVISILATVFLSSLKTRLAQRLAFICFCVGVMFVVLSSTPLPYWYYGITIAATLYWLWTLKKPAARNKASLGMAILWTGAILLEAPWHIIPESSSSVCRSLAIVGDSVTAGMGDGEAETWPNLLARQNDLQVHDVSHVGETAKSAFRRVQQQHLTADTVLSQSGHQRMADLVWSLIAPPPAGRSHPLPTQR